MRVRVLSTVLATLLVLAFVSCQSTREGESGVVTIDPSDVVVMLNRSRNFTATMSGTNDPGVTWSTTGGTIAGSGETIVYTAPSILGVYEVTAASTADPRARATATVRVVAYPDQAWASQYSSDRDDVVTAMAIDSGDNIVIVGYTTGALFPVPELGYDAFVAKIAPDGTPVWAHQFGTSASDFANAVAVDSGDNVLLAGQTFGDLYAANAGDGDAFVAKISPAGVPLWGVQDGTIGLDTARAVAVDASDSVLLGGFTGADLFAPNQGGRDAFIAKVTSSGLPIGGFQYGTNGHDSVAALAVDSADDIVLAGSTSGDLFAANQGAHDGFVAKVTPTGVVVAAVQYGSSGDEWVAALAIDSADDIVLAGSTSGDLFATNQGVYDGFVVKVATDGTLVWAVQHGTRGDDGIHALAVDSADNVLMGGASEGGLFAVNAGSRDGVFAVLGPDGGIVRQDQFGSTGYDVVASVAVASTGGIVLAGFTGGDVAGPNQGNLDAFLIALHP